MSTRLNSVSDPVRRLSFAVEFSYPGLQRDSLNPELVRGAMCQFMVAELMRRPSEASIFNCVSSRPMEEFFPGEDQRKLSQEWLVAPGSGRTRST